MLVDDILIFGNDKASLKNALRRSEVFLQEKLHLQIKEASVSLNTRLHGLSLLGFRIFSQLIRMKAFNVKRMVAKIKLRQYEHKTGVIDEDALYRSVQSMLGLAARRLFFIYMFLFTALFFRGIDLQI